jgi:uncharacterized protein (TIGR02147 family)
MKTVSVFDFGEYKAFIKAWIAERPLRGRGEKARIAKAMRCHSAYVSQVLERSAQLSLEQAAALAEYMGLGEQEGRFLLLLVQSARAGSKQLRKLFDRQIQEVLEARTLLRNRMEESKTIEAKDQATYYSSYLYAAVHMAISLPGFQTKQELASWLTVPQTRIAEVLTFLAQVGLAIEEGGRYRPGQASIYLPENSPLISKHHGNWRNRAVHSMDVPQLHDLHYSSVATLNSKDLPKIRAILVKAIEEVRAVIRASTDEDTVFCYDLDLFRA